MTGHRRLIAILRGLEPDRARDVGELLVTAGITRIEVPLNSPEPLTSIDAMATTLAGRAEIGAGTVIDAAAVAPVKAAGGSFVVAPNCDIEVIGASAAHGMASWPGVLTPTEAFTALKAGATGLKIFPASVLGIGGIRALRAVLPLGTQVYAVGGVDAPAFGDFAAAGCDGFGLGTSLFVPGRTLDDVAARARTMVEAHDAVFGGAG